MTQRDPDPANLPEAIPVLSYESQMDDGAMHWVVRFIGAWVICNGATSIVVSCVQEALQGGRMGFHMPSTDNAVLWIGSLTSILFGIAIVRQQRYGFYGQLILQAMGPLYVLHWLYSLPQVALLHSLLTFSISAAAMFAMVLSVLRRADAQAILQPIRLGRPYVQTDGSSISFLISRMGWVYLTEGGVVAINLATWPLLIWAKVPVGQWNWESSVHVAFMLALAVAGLLMCQRKAWAVWLVVAILPLTRTVVPLLSMWQYYLSNTPAFSAQARYFILSTASTAANVFMLCLLARKAARSRI